MMNMTIQQAAATYYTYMYTRATHGRPYGITSGKFEEIVRAAKILRTNGINTRDKKAVKLVAKGAK
jgi:hypothetical protein